MIKKSKKPQESRTTSRQEALTRQDAVSLDTNFYLEKRANTYKKQSDIDDTKTLKIINKVHNLLLEVKIVLESAKSSNRILKKIEFIDVTSKLKTVSNNLVFLKALDSDLAKTVTSLLLSNTDTESGDYSHFKYDIDRVTIAHVLNIEFFYQSHIAQVDLQPPIHIQLLNEIYSEGKLFDTISNLSYSAQTKDILPEESGVISGSASGAAAGSSEAEDIYYGLEYINLPHIVGSLSKKTINNYQYQLAFKGNENSLLQLLKFNINLAISILGDTSSNNVNLFSLAIEASGNCAKILKALNHELYSHYEPHLLQLILTRNYLAHSINIIELDEIRTTNTNLIRTLEILSKTLSDIREADYPSISSKVLVQEVNEEAEEITNSRSTSSGNKKSNHKNDILTAELESQIIEQAIREIGSLTMQENISSAELAKKEIGNSLVELMLEENSSDTFDKLTEIINNPNFDPNYLITIRHPSYKVTIKEEKETPIRSLKSFEKLIATLSSGTTSETMQESHLLALNCIIFKAIQSDDQRYYDIIYNIFTLKNIDLSRFESLDVSQNPLLMILSYNKIKFNDGISHNLNLFYSEIKKYFPLLSKALFKNYHNSLIEPTSKMIKFLVPKLNLLHLDLEIFSIACDDVGFFTRNVNLRTMNQSGLKSIIKSIAYYNSKNIYAYFKSTGINFYKFNYSDDESGLLLAPLMSNNISLLKEFLDGGMNPNQIIRDLRTPALNLAIKYGYNEIAKLLINTTGIDLNKKDQEEVTPIFEALRTNNTEIIQILINDRRVDLNYYYSNTKISPLLYSCMHSNYEIVEKLLESGRVNLNHCNIKNASAIYLACYRGDVRIVKKLLEFPIDIDFPANSDVCPLFVASEDGHTEIVKALLNRGVRDINFKNCNGETSLMAACRKGHIEIIDTLLASGADYLMLSDFGYNAITSAILSDKPEILKKFESLNVDLKNIKYNEISLISFAVAQNCNKVAKYLLENEVSSSDSPELNAQTLLDIAIVTNDTINFAFLSQIEEEGVIIEHIGNNDTDSKSD